MDEFEKKKRELLTPLLVEAGAALMDCQQFEHGLALLLLHFARLGNPGLDAAGMFRVLENKDKKTAGQLIALLRKHTKASPGIDTALDEGLDARNTIIHRFFTENIELVVKAETREKLVKELRRLRGKVREADATISPFVLAFGEALDGVFRDKLEEEARAMFS
jgi:hypothetical protein